MQLKRLSEMNDNERLILAEMVDLLAERIADHLRAAWTHRKAPPMGIHPPVREGAPGTWVSRDEARVLRFLQKTTSYGDDKLFGPMCRAGLMPHSKLLKLSSLTSRDFNAVIARLIKQELVKVISHNNFGYCGLVYQLN